MGLLNKLLGEAKVGGGKLARPLPGDLEVPDVKEGLDPAGVILDASRGKDVAHVLPLNLFVLDLSGVIGIPDAKVIQKRGAALLGKRHPSGDEVVVTLL